MTACKGGLPVRIKDIQPRGINHALKYSWDLLNKQVRQRRLRPVERDRQMALISGTTDYQGFAHRDVVIEAVFEDLALKQRMVSEVEQYGGPQTIFASNTNRRYCRSRQPPGAGNRPAFFQSGGKNAAG